MRTFLTQRKKGYSKLPTEVQLSNTDRAEAMSHFLGRIQSISFLVPPLTFQQIPPSPLSGTALQLVLSKRGRENEKRKTSISNSHEVIVQQCLSWPVTNLTFSLLFVHGSSALELTFLFSVLSLCNPSPS